MYLSFVQYPFYQRHKKRFPELAPGGEKLLFILTITVLFFACEKEFSAPAASETSQEIESRSDDGKINVCHYAKEDDSWHVINISGNAWPAHEAHGDVRLENWDGDGWVAAVNACVPGGDCNDEDPAVNPGVDETPYNGKSH